MNIVTSHRLCTDEWHLEHKVIRFSEKSDPSWLRLVWW